MTDQNNLVYLNGQFMPLEQAKISVLDRGFLFGDGVYEVIPAYRGKLFRLDQHLDRLEASLKKIRMEAPMTRREWDQVLSSLLIAEQDQTVYVQVTRGTTERRDHAIPIAYEPTVFAKSTLLAPSEIPSCGIRAITLPDSRWSHCDIKAITLLPNTLLRQQAMDKNCSEAILIRDGYVTEGAASNVFVIKDKTLSTPPKSPRILPGITRDVILEIAARNNISNEETEISSDQLRTADEIWLSSSVREILPVVELDGVPVGTGNIGPLWYKMVDLYTLYKQSL